MIHCREISIAEPACLDLGPSPQIDNAEQLISMNLSSSQNKLLRAEVSFTMIMTWVQIGVLVFGIFGMNLHSGLEWNDSGPWSPKTHTHRGPSWNFLNVGGPPFAKGLSVTFCAWCEGRHATNSQVSRCPESFHDWVRTRRCSSHYVADVKCKALCVTTDRESPVRMLPRSPSSPPLAWSEAAF